MKKLWKNCAGVLACSVLCLSGPSCTWLGRQASVRPTITEDRQSSFDGNVKDSGVIKIDQDGVLVTQSVVDRYEAMIRVYGHSTVFQPVLKPGAGVTVASPEDFAANPGRGPLYRLTKEAFGHFVVMNEWRKNAIKPPQQQP